MIVLAQFGVQDSLSQWTHDRSSLIRSGYWPASVNADTLFSVDVFSTYENMKTVAPGLSRQGILRLLEQRTQQFGRKGKIHGDVFQRSFMEYTFWQFLCEKMADVEHFTAALCYIHQNLACGQLCSILSPQQESYSVFHFLKGRLALIECAIGVCCGRWRKSCFSSSSSSNHNCKIGMLWFNLQYDTGLPA
ncbi:hypothetical protein QQF64_020044 [Cirrhinus molitorella]|uniref:Uncharacterized protein n=1 Tax=Cirrhinus molitorella TaxID=172907 RepID=A0ABR3LHD8_9TELE